MKQRKMPACESGDRVKGEPVTKTCVCCGPTSFCVPVWDKGQIVGDRCTKCGLMKPHSK